MVIRILIINRTCCNRRYGKKYTAIVREQPNPISASLMASLNEVFDMTAAGRFAFDFRLPPQIFWLLMGLALLGIASLGFQLGCQRITDLWPGGAVALTWTVVIVDMWIGGFADGYLRTSVAPYEWTLQGFSSETASPARQ